VEKTMSDVAAHEVADERVDHGRGRTYAALGQIRLLRPARVLPRNRCGHTETSLPGCSFCR
jgi:hypothetical protein